MANMDKVDQYITSWNIKYSSLMQVNICFRQKTIVFMHLSMLTPRGGGSGKGWGFDQSGGPMGRDLD